VSRSAWSRWQAGRARCCGRSSGWSRWTPGRWRCPRPPSMRSFELVIGGDRVVSSIDAYPTRCAGWSSPTSCSTTCRWPSPNSPPSGWRERWVGRDDDGLTFVDADPSPRSRDGSIGSPDRSRWVVGSRCSWKRSAGCGVGDRLEAGAVVLFDYGDTAENLAPRRQDGTLRTYRAHHLGPHPLDEPGATDITADVNFTAIEAAAREAGAEVELWRQDDFLARSVCGTGSRRCATRSWTGASRRRDGPPSPPHHARRPRPCSIPEVSGTSRCARK
jgi:hypothetical protein